MSMETETKSYYEWSDRYESERNQFKDDALREFYDEINRLTLLVEHYVPVDLEGEEVYKSNPRVASTIDKILDRGKYFVYTTELEDGSRTYIENFDYDFSEYAEDHLSDSLGYYKAGENND